MNDIVEHDIKRLRAALRDIKQYAAEAESRLNSIREPFSAIAFSELDAQIDMMRHVADRSQDILNNMRDNIKRASRFQPTDMRPPPRVF